MRRDCPARDQHLRRKRTERITTRPKNQKGEATCKQCKRATLLGCWHVSESYVLPACKRSISDPAHTSGCLCSPRATHAGHQPRRRRTGTCSGTRRTVEPPDRKKKIRAAKISTRKPNERHHAGHHLKKTCTNRTKKNEKPGTSRCGHAAERYMSTACKPTRPGAYLRFLVPVRRAEAAGKESPAQNWHLQQNKTEQTTLPSNTKKDTGAGNRTQGPVTAGDCGPTR